MHKRGKFQVHKRVLAQTAQQPTSGDQRRQQATTQPPEPPPTDLLQFTLRQRRSRPAATTADNATARASNGPRTIAIYTKAPQPTSGDQRRQQPTTQPPEPLTERDLLQFTLRKRRSRPPDPLTERDLLQFTLRQRRLWLFPLRQRRRLCVVSVCVISARVVSVCVVSVCVVSVCVVSVCVVSVCVVSVCVASVCVVSVCVVSVCVVLCAL